MAQGYGGYGMGYQQKAPEYTGGGYQASQGGYYGPPPYEAGYHQHPAQQPYGGNAPYHQGPSLGGYQQQQNPAAELPKNSNWGEPIDKSRIHMFREQFIPADFEMNNQATEYSMLLKEIEAIKEKAKNDEGGEWPSRLHKLM